MNFKRFNGSTWETVQHKIYGSGTDSLTAFPAIIQASGDPITDYKIYGNTVQDGTPTPEAPVDVVGCGEKTENVMPAGEQKTVEVNGVTFSSDGKGKYTIIGTATDYTSARFNLLSAFKTPISVSNGGQGTLSFFNTQSTNDVTFIFYNGTINVDDWKQIPAIRTSTAYNIIGNKYVDNVVITVNPEATVDMTITPEFTNNGVLPSSFEPYGYKLPLTVNGTEHPIYLWQVSTTRRIKKMVLTGEENWSTEPVAGIGRAYMQLPDQVIQGVGLSTHYIFQSGKYEDGYCSVGPTGLLYIYSSVYASSTATFKSYLATQYANGTPVTIWYVLANPATGIVNEPLHKIGDYADTITMAQAGVAIPTSDGDNIISFGTTVQPSAMSAAFKGWHPVQGAKQYDGNDWS